MAKKSKMKLPIQEVIGVVTGAVAAGVVTKFVNDKFPNIPNSLKSLIPIGVGVFLAGNKNTIIRGAGFGMVAKGGSDLAAAFIPNIAGVDDLFLSSPADQSVLSAPADMSLLSGYEDGIGEDYMGEDYMGEDYIGEDYIGEDISGEDSMLMGADDNIGEYAEM
jgi:hypothetical protein